jgi:hypothetical protein
MFPQELSEKAPAALLIIASAILAAVFTLPIGPERRMGTSYQRLEGWVGAFTKLDSTSSALPRPASDAASAAPASITNALQPSNGERIGVGRTSGRPAAHSKAETASTRKSLSKKREKAATAKVAVSSAPVAATPPAVAIAAPVETADNVADEYEGNAAKYPLDGEAAREPVTLRLRGVSRATERYILKVAVLNRGREDFFIKELAIRDGQEILETRFFMRLFVEPGRTREGYVVFEKPRNGANIQVALKEDREKGRVLELAVPYPF